MLTDGEKGGEKGGESAESGESRERAQRERERGHEENEGTGRRDSGGGTTAAKLERQSRHSGGETEVAISAAQRARAESREPRADTRQHPAPN